MAKKGKKADKGARDEKSKLPKSVAGVKIPKDLRKQGDTLTNLITSPVARELLADALIAVAGVLAGNKRNREAIADTGSHAASGAKDIGQTATGAVAEVVTEAARRILPSSVVGESSEAKKTDKKPRGAGAEPPVQGGGGRKKSASATRAESEPGFVE